MALKGFLISERGRKVISMFNVCILILNHSLLNICYNLQMKKKISNFVELKRLPLKMSLQRNLTCSYIQIRQSPWLLAATHMDFCRYACMSALGSKHANYTIH